MMNINMSQFKVLLIKELKEVCRDKRVMLSDVSAMMNCSATNLVKCLVKGVAA